MRILLIVGPLSGRGGIETCIVNMAAQAAIRGDVFSVFSLCPSTSSGLWHQSIDYEELEFGIPSLKIQAIYAPYFVAKKILNFRPDVIVSIYSSTLFLIKLSMFFARYKAPLFSWVHFSLSFKQRVGLLKYADGHICISRGIHDGIIAKFKNPNGRVFLVNNSTIVNGVLPIPRSMSGPFRFLYIGRLMVGGQKRVDLIFKNLASIDADWVLDIVGDGTDRKNLKELAVHLEIDKKIKWHGWLDDPWSAVDSADCLLMCSAFEGFPMVLIEAMARGIPCISSNCPSGPDEIVVDGENGWLFDYEDNNAIRSKMMLVIENRGDLPSIDLVRSSVSKFDVSVGYLDFRAALTSISI